MFPEQYIDFFYSFITEKGNIVDMIKKLQEKNGYCYSTELWDALIQSGIIHPGIYADGYVTNINGREYTIMLTRDDVKEYYELGSSGDRISFYTFLQRKYDNRIALKNKLKIAAVAAACIVAVMGASAVFKQTPKPDIVSADVPAVQTAETQETQNNKETEAAPTETKRQTEAQTAKTETEKQTEIKQTEQAAAPETTVQQTETEQTQPAEIRYGETEIGFYFIADELEAQLINATESPYCLYLDGTKIDGDILPNDYTNFTGAIEAGEHTIYVKSGANSSKEFTITVDPDEELNLFEFELRAGVRKPELKKR
ncbi:MAG: hypothetical protein MSJ26_00155 [Oscillospiraceae bacterium]|nr:hypothetical protein [Oscillospiraceae bacterium]